MSEQLEERITELGRQVQILQEAFSNHLEDHISDCEQTKVALDGAREKLIDSIIAIKDEIVNQVLQEL